MVVEVWSSPKGRGQKTRYADAVRYTARAGESLPVELDGQIVRRIAVTDLVVP